MTPSGHALIGEGRLIVTPDLADQIIADMRYEGQRRLDLAHVAELAAALLRGAMAAGSQIAFVRYKGKLYLINGQHRIHAVSRSRRPLEFQVLIVDCASEADIARHYFTFDRMAKHRSDGDVLASQRVASRYGISATMAKAVWAALPLIQHRFDRLEALQDPNRRDDDLRLFQAEPWWSLAAEMQEILAVAPNHVRKRLVSSQGVSVSLVLLKHQPVAARAFLGGIAADDGLRRTDPRKALLIDLGRRRWVNGTLDGCLILSYAWNAYVEGRSIGHLKVVENARFRLAGTPFDGRL